MGYTKNLQVGAYVEYVPVKLPVKSKVFITKCTNDECPSCGITMNHRFCYDCSSPITPRVGESISYNSICFSEIVEELEIDGDTFRVVSNEYDDNEVEYIFSNLSRLCLNNDGDFEVTQITPALIESTINEFKTTYFMELAAIEKHLGVELEVKFGVISYYS